MPTSELNDENFELQKVSEQSVEELEAYKQHKAKLEDFKKRLIDLATPKKSGDEGPLCRPCFDEKENSGQEKTNVAVE